MATGLDLIVGLECAMVVTARSRAYKPVARFANPALIVAFPWSAGLNAFAFSAASSLLWMTVVAASVGASIPALIYAGTRSWAYDRDADGPSWAPQQPFRRLCRRVSALRWQRRICAWLPASATI
jgi:hypothetical protein